MSCMYSYFLFAPCHWPGVVCSSTCWVLLPAGNLRRARQSIDLMMARLKVQGPGANADKFDSRYDRFIKDMIIMNFQLSYTSQTQISIPVASSFDTHPTPQLSWDVGGSQVGAISPWPWATTSVACHGVDLALQFIVPLVVSTNCRARGNFTQRPDRLEGLRSQHFAPHQAFSASQVHCLWVACS